jgi:AcrR family transcriptional regulator
MASEAALNGSEGDLSARERELLRAAAIVFARQGYGNATVQEVADELGILKGSVYHYIRTKDDLLFGVIKEVLERVEVMYAEVAAETGLEPLERFAFCVRRQVRFAQANRTALAVYARDSELLSDQRREWVRDSRRRNTAFVARLVDDAQTAGVATRRHDADAIARLSLAAVASTVIWFDPAKDVEELANSCAEFFVLGIVGENPV